MKPYMVEITTYGVVMAEDETHAHQVADSYKREIFGDDWNPRIEVGGAVVKVDDLSHGWDGECIPYGGDGNTTLAALLVPQPLSWGDRMELAQRLRREAAEKIAEAERIEKGLEDDQNAVWEAVQKMRAKQVPNAEL